MSVTRIFFINSENMLLESLDVFFSSQDDFTVVGKADCGAAALKLAPQLNPDVLLIDLNVPDMDGISLLSELRQACPCSKQLILTARGENQNVLDAIGAGVDGYIFKNAGKSAIINAARVIAGGHSVIDRKILSLLNGYVKRAMVTEEDFEFSESEYRGMLDVLKEHERDICMLVGKGKSNREISEALHLTEGTVKNYLSRIYNKLGLRDRTSLAVIMARHCG